MHTCPGGDRDSTHSADVDYAELLPSLFQLKVGNFYIALAGEKDRARVLKIIRESHEAGPAGVRRRRRADRPARRDAGGSARPGARGGRVHPGRAARHDRRLRLLAVLRRHLDHAATPRSRRSRARCSAPRSRPKRSEPVDGGQLDDEEDELLRSVALQNAQSILLARQRAEQELLRAKEALERKTRELADSLAMMRATLEATWDGILVTDHDGHVTNFNRRFVDMWRIPPEIVKEARRPWRSHRLLRRAVRGRRPGELPDTDRSDLCRIAGRQS